MKLCFVVAILCIALRSAAAQVDVSLVFVSRQIVPNGSVYWPDETGSQPGVGPFSRFRPAAPGRLVRREPSGELRVLIDGANPTPASLNLIDVDAPDVSWDGARIVFAGLPKGDYSSEPTGGLGAWRIFVINADGMGLRQLTFTDAPLSADFLADFFQQPGDRLALAGGRFHAEGYDDTDPVWLPDGRIVFSSTRWFTVGEYSAVRASNLFVVNDDGSALHRITAERNGADRPLIDPLTGRVVFARWWRNHRLPSESMATVVDAPSGKVYHTTAYQRKDGLATDAASGGAGASLALNFWQIGVANPDGTSLGMWSGFMRDSDANHFYGGAFAADGTLYANFFPMANMTEAAGFGGIRRYQRGAGRYEPVIGVTMRDDKHYANSSPPSFGISPGPYASEPAVLPDGRLIISWAKDHKQDYGLYLIQPDGSGLALVHDVPGTSEVRAQPIIARPRPPIIADGVTTVASRLPPGAGEPFDKDGTFVFDALNVYFNAPVDWDIVSAIPVGSAGSIRFYLDHQRNSHGSIPEIDWPIFLKELPVAADGSVREEAAPANVPLFEQLRTPQASGYRVPRTGGARPGPNDGAAHVAGLNYGRPGQVASCVGCHAGHTMIPLPKTREEALWSNLAPGARLAASSSVNAESLAALTDRRQLTGEQWRTWTSAGGQARGQWVQLTFPVDIQVRTVRLYNPRPGGDGQSTLQVRRATVKLFRDETAANEVASAVADGNLKVSGTEVPFADVPARVVKVFIDDVQGTLFGQTVASLGEIEVIAKAGLEPSRRGGVKLRARRDGGAAIVEWDEETGWTYALQAAPSLIGPWTEIKRSSGAGQAQRQQETLGLETARFYRVLALTAQ